MRSGSLGNPKPLVAFDCGSQSTSSVFTSAAAKEAAKLMAVVVLPTPPFWLATAITRPINHFQRGCVPRGTLKFHEQILNGCSTWNIWRNVFHVEHTTRPTA